MVDYARAAAHPHKVPTVAESTATVQRAIRVLVRIRKATLPGQTGTSSPIRTVTPFLLTIPRSPPDDPTVEGERQ